MEREFSVENLVFYKKCSEYALKAMEDPSCVKDLAVSIYDTFISESGLMQVRRYYGTLIADIRRSLSLSLSL